MAYTADKLFTLDTLEPHPHKPDWANLVAKQRVAEVPDDLAGPGLYALFLDGQLFYIGLHVTEGAFFQAPVLDRWVLHVVGQMLRAKAISFSAGPLAKMLGNLTGTPVDDIAALLPEGRMTDRTQLREHPLVAGSHCTYNKARFATLNWDRVDPGNEATLLGRITCVFRHVPRACEQLLSAAEGRDRGQWVREFWLRPLETDLIAKYRPICNSQTVPGMERQDVGVAEIERALEEAMATPFLAFDADALAVHRNKRKPAPRAVVEAFDTDSSIAPDETEIALAEDEGLSEAELRFRRNLSPAGAPMICWLQDHCPGHLQLYYTGNNDLRIALTYGRERVLVVLKTSHGRLRVTTLASVEACQALGLAAEPITGATMRAGFVIDPAEHDPGLLLQVADAAAQAVAG